MAGRIVSTKALFGGSPSSSKKTVSSKELFSEPDDVVHHIADFARSQVGPQMQAVGGAINTAGFGLPGMAASHLPQPIQDYMQPKGVSEKIGRGVGDVAGFMMGPGKVAKMGAEAIPFLHAASKAPGLIGAGMNAVKGGLETGAAFGMMQPQGHTDLAIPERMEEAKKGAIVGTLLPVLGEIGNTFGKPSAVFAQHMLTGTIPLDEAKAVINEPHKIGKEWLKSQYDKASQLWKQHVEPKIKGQGYNVDLHGVNAQINTGEIPLLSGEKILLKAPDGTPTGKWMSMSPSEQKAIEKIQDDIYFHQKSPTFNSAHSIIGDIDKYLSKNYDVGNESLSYEGVPKSGIFDAVMKSLRGQVFDSIAKDQPEAANAIKEMREYYKWQGRANMYKGTNMTFFKSLGPRLLLIAGLGMKAPVAGLAAGLGTMPAAWGAGIRAGSELGKIPFEGLTGTAKEFIDETAKHTIHKGMD